MNLARSLGEVIAALNVAVVRFLADDAELDLSHDEAAARVEQTLAQLDAELVGLGPVKRRVREIVE